MHIHQSRQQRRIPEFDHSSVGRNRGWIDGTDPVAVNHNHARPANLARRYIEHPGSANYYCLADQRSRYQHDCRCEQKNAAECSF
jgi:hypothetical protein